MTRHLDPLDHPHQAAEAYFRDGERWGQEIYDAAQGSARRAWRVAAGAGAVAFLAVAALIGLTPLKSTQPYVVLVDRTTGYMERVDRVEPVALTANAALVRADVVRFLQSHEVWDPTDFQERARLVRLAATPEVYRAFLGELDRRAERLTLADARTLHIKSVSLDEADGRAFVRFSTTTTLASGRRTDAHWAASLSYRYTATPPDRDTAFINPLGFQVTRLRIDQESVAAAEARTLQPTAVADAMSALPMPETPAGSRSSRLDPAARPDPGTGQ